MTYPNFWRFARITQGQKAPYEQAWTNNHYEEYEIDITKTGIGLLLGAPSAGVVAIDFDGNDAQVFFEDNIMPMKTLLQHSPIRWSSGKPGRFQVAFLVDEEYWSVLKTCKVGPNQHLEFRWTGGQSVLPPSLHPETAGYKWDNEPNGTNDILNLPAEVLSYWLEVCNPPSAPRTAYTGPPATEDDVRCVLTFLQKHNARPGHTDWYETTWAVAHTLGGTQAVIIMKEYFPERQDDTVSYADIMRSWKHSKSPKFGRLIIEARKYDPAFRLETPTPEPVLIQEDVEDEEAIKESMMPLLHETIALMPIEVREAIAAARTAGNFPEEMCLMSALAVMNLAAQQMYDIDTELFNTTSLSEFFVLLQDSSGGKSTVSKMFMKGVEDARTQKRIKYTEEMKQYKFDNAVYRNDLRKATQGGSATEPILPIKFDPIVSKTTLNGLHNHMNTCPSGGIFSTEGTEFINGYDQKTADGEGNFAAALSKFWSGEEIKKDTGMGSVSLIGRRCCLYLALQKELSANLVANARYRDQGLESRLLLVDSRGWDKPYEDDGTKQRKKDCDLALEGFNRRICDMLLKSLTVSQYDNCELILPVLKFETDASAKRRVSYNKFRDIETKQTEFKSFTGKLYQHACKLAGTIAAFKGDTFISVETWEAADKLAMYFWEQRKRFIAPDDKGDWSKTAKAREALIDWLLEKHAGKEITKEHIRQYAPSPFRNHLESHQKTSVVDDVIAAGVLIIIEGSKKLKVSMKT